MTNERDLTHVTVTLPRWMLEHLAGSLNFAMGYDGEHGNDPDPDDVWMQQALYAAVECRATELSLILAPTVVHMSGTNTRKADNG